MIDQNLIKENINGIQELLGILKSYKDYKFADIKAEYHLYASLRYAYIELIERAIDINQHIIKESGTEVPQDYTETFELLSKMDVLDKKLAPEIAKSAGLRNVVVHEYKDVDDKQLYDSIDIALDQYPKYNQSILDFIKKHN